MKILGIETSCDDTAASVVEDGRLLLSNVIASQVELHNRYGGVVPEVASWQHVLEIIPTIQESLAQSGCSFNDIDAIAVTNGPGLAGSLIVGLNTAKALAFGNDLPLIGINHLEGHVYANWLDGDAPDESPGFPLLCLIASGGHTDLILMSNHGEYELLGRTRDDAAGEAFDKAARVLGLGFPGGPEIQKASQNALGNIDMPRAWLRGSLDFSFSGLKTAFLNKAKDLGISAQSIGQTLETLYGGKTVTKFNKLGKEYPIILQQYSDDRKDQESLSKIFVRSENSGKLISLANLVDFKE